MHHIVFAIRQIAPADLPRVRDVTTGALAPATLQQLADMGLVPLGGDFYSCAEQYHSDVVDTEQGPVRVWFPADARPADLATAPRSAHAAAIARADRGQLLTHGSPRERHAALPPAVRAQVMRVRVQRTTGVGKNRVTERLHVAAGDVQPDDVVEASDLIPHRWAGER